MTTKVASEPLAAQAAELMETDDLPTQVRALAVDLDCFDRALVAIGTIADQALAKASALESGLAAAMRAAEHGDPEPEPPPRSMADVVYNKLAERRRKAETRQERIERSGFRLVQGGGA